MHRQACSRFTTIGGAVRACASRALTCHGIATVVAALIAVVMAAPAVAEMGLSTTRPAPDAATKAQILEAWGKLPLGFEANDGQAPREAKFLARGSGYNLSLTATEAVLALQKLPAATHGDRQPAPVEQVLLRMRLAGANPAPSIEATDELPGKVNYLTGNAPTQWRRNVRTYGKVRYREVYPGVELVYYGNQRQLEYDFIVAPATDPSIITLNFGGTSSLSIDAGSDLLLHIGDTQARLRKPIVYQKIAGVRRDVAGSFVMRGSDAVGFEIGAYDTSQPLVIDPILVYSVVLGSSAGDGGTSISVDASGNAYFTGWAVGFNFPTTSGTLQMGSADAFVFKSTDGANSWGSSSSGITSPIARAIAVDPVDSSNVYVITFGGVFKSTNGGSSWGPSNTGLPFPLSSLAVVVVDPLTPATLYAGTSTGVFKSTNAGATWSASSTGLPSSALALAIDPLSTSTLYAATGSGFVYKSTDSGGSWSIRSNGLTWSPETLAIDPLAPSTVYAGTNGGVFKTTNGGGLWFATSTGLTGTIIAGLVIDPVTPSTLYVADSISGRVFKSTSGANSWSVSDAGVGNRTIRALAIAPTNPSTVYAAANFATDAVVVKLDPVGALVYSTYLGGAGFDHGNGVAVDSLGNAYVVGDTQSADFPTVSALQTALVGRDDAFVVKLDPTGSALLYSTYLGGGCVNESGSDIAVDSASSIHVVGRAGNCSPNNFPTTPTAFQPFCSSGDAYVARIDPMHSGSASLVYSTCFAGGNTIAVDLANNTYVAGSVSSTALPVLNAFQPTGGGGTDAFVAKFDTYQAGAASLLYASYLGGSSSDTVSGIAVDSSRNAYVTGTTSSTNFPTTLGAFQTVYGGGSSDAFAAKVDPSQVGPASLIYTTYLGANDTDHGSGVAVDPVGNAHVAGAAGTNFPLLNPLQTGGSGFLAKLNAGGSALIYIDSHKPHPQRHHGGPRFHRRPLGSRQLLRQRCIRNED